MIQEIDLEEHCKDMTPREFKAFILDFELNIMEAILEKKMDEGKIVFSGAESELLN